MSDSPQVPDPSPAPQAAPRKAAPPKVDPPKADFPKGDLGQAPDGKAERPPLFSAAWFRRRFRRPAQVSVLRLHGVIGASAGPLRGSRLNLAGMAGAIEAAFRPRRLAAVALVINSPGGSPVQSAAIANRIRQLADERKVPVFAFAEDVAASGGYWIACCADEIYADRSSIVGSIGVIASGFGATGLIEKLGVERRVHAAGSRKSFWDPFLAEDPEDVARLKALQAKLHEGFIDWVRERRADRLPEEGGEDLFSGAFWLGAEARDLGLIDGLGDLRTVMRARFGKNVRLRLVATRSSWLQRRLGVLLGGQDPASGAALPAGAAAGMAAGLADLPGQTLAAVEDRLLWGRFGL